MTAALPPEPLGELTEPAHTDGAPAVADGRRETRLLLVLDPRGSGRHDELPATWRPFTAEHRVVWCRMPAEDAMAQAEQAFAAETADRPPGDIVASGPFAAIALDLAEQHSALLRSVLLIDPAADGFLARADDAQVADQDWEADNSGRLTDLREAGIGVKVVAHSPGGDQDRVPAPLPLGHPDVVAGLTVAFDELI
ncbi:hypothetical protein [Amycolatopsis sp. H20-H5]|uniref:hypothetical protein n=1 Tax=Amycolatopsis sp. H20-H5 TaxID=3046309 RepID=UPI002DBFCDE2|nr:hypothetical protein [Amycolatopsis sp. H20-H5]MEC3981496.1 hypothetical protein [Amycolatopsis sp. H20-H5]